MVMGFFIVLALLTQFVVVSANGFKVKDVNENTVFVTVLSSRGVCIHSEYLAHSVGCLRERCLWAVLMRISTLMPKRRYRGAMSTSCGWGLSSGSCRGSGMRQ